MKTSSVVNLANLPEGHPILRLLFVRKSLSTGFSSVHNLWALGSLGLLHAHSRTPLPSDKRPDWFDDTEFMKTQIDEADKALAAAILILAYTVAAELVTDLCQISVQCDLSSWVRFVRKEKVTLGDVIDSSPEDVSRREVDKYMARLRMTKSLPSNCANLWSVLGPVDSRTVVPEYIYDQAELKTLNNLRCDCVHGFRFRTTIADVRSKVTYLHQTVRFFGMLTQRKYSLETGQKTLDEWP